MQEKRSDYVGEYFYENDTLKFIHHEEGRVVMTGTEPEYQFHLKDHLGNVRLTYTTKPEIESATATMDNASEESEFLYYNEAVKINNPLFDKTYDNTTGPSYYATRLSGGNTNEIFGLAKSLSVMPGDTVRMEVSAKYLDNETANWTTALSDLMALVASQNALVYIDGGAVGSIGGQTFPFEGVVTKTGTGVGPKAYLNWIITDRNWQPLDGGYVRMSDVAKEHGQNVAHEILASQVVITEPGYVYIYLSNENETPVEVFFDDFIVEHVKSPVVQMDDYYPFGLTFNSYSRENSTTQNFKYNGVENEDELELNINTTFFRMHDPTLGRWWQIDPKPDEMFSPYSAMSNNPLRYSDPLGDTVRVYTETAGAGHAWISVGDGDNMTVYTYGRYAGTNEEWHGINTLSNGPGVLLKLQGEDAAHYNETKSEKTGSTTFQVLDVTDAAVAEVLEKQFSSSDELPSSGEYKDDPRAHVISDYKLFSNNCTTIVSDALNAAGSEATERLPDKAGVQRNDRFVVPASLQSFLTWQSTSILGNGSVRIQQTKK